MSERGDNGDIDASVISSGLPVLWDLVLERHGEWYV
jgi:hypothetical protein